jgi:hypothetical protein
VVVNEQTDALLACSLLQRKGDQVPETTMRQRVLAREEPIVRLESNVRTRVHRFGQDVRGETTGQRRRDGLLEEDPDVSAST